MPNSGILVSLDVLSAAALSCISDIPEASPQELCHASAVGGAVTNVLQHVYSFKITLARKKKKKKCGYIYPFWLHFLDETLFRMQIPLVLGGIFLIPAPERTGARAVRHPHVYFHPVCSHPACFFMGTVNPSFSFPSLLGEEILLLPREHLLLALRWLLQEKLCPLVWPLVIWATCNR